MCCVWFFAGSRFSELLPPVPSSGKADEQAKVAPEFDPAHWRKPGL
jgi:hypothetical protein